MKFYQVDAFTDEVFKGNPAAVCLLNKDYNNSILQNIAMEMNLSETAFLKKLGNNEFDLRWFTPETEVTLCGHATLASAHTLWENKKVQKDDKLIFHTLSGKLEASKKGDWIQLNFPKGNLKPSVGDKYLLDSFSTSPAAIYEDDEYYLLEFNNEEVIAQLRPDFNTLLKADKKEIIVTSLSDNKSYDFVSRFFAPALGINEDPVTGSAHCYLAPYWIKKLNKDEVIGCQLSKRTGLVKCRTIDNRVLIEGKARTIIEGDLLINL